MSKIELGDTRNIRVYGQIEVVVIRPDNKWYFPYGCLINSAPVSQYTKNFLSEKEFLRHHSSTILKGSQIQYMSPSKWRQHRFSWFSLSELMDVL